MIVGGPLNCSNSRDHTAFRNGVTFNVLIVVRKEQIKSGKSSKVESGVYGGVSNDVDMAG